MRLATVFLRLLAALDSKPTLIVYRTKWC